MSKIDDVKAILKTLHVPSKQQSELCCLTLLAMANLKEDDPWENVSNNWTRIHDVIQFIGSNYGVH